MIQAVQLDMSVTLGDFIVTGGSILTIIICFIAMKTVLETISSSLEKLTIQCDGHDELLIEHGEDLAALDAAVFGRRRQDRDRSKAHSRKPARLQEEGT